MSLCTKPNKVFPLLQSKSPHNCLPGLTWFHFLLLLWLYLLLIFPHVLFSGLLCLSSGVPSTFSLKDHCTYCFLCLELTSLVSMVFPHHFQISASNNSHLETIFPDHCTYNPLYPTLSLRPNFIFLYSTFHYLTHFIFLVFVLFSISCLCYLECKLQNGKEFVLFTAVSLAPGSEPDP